MGLGQTDVDGMECVGCHNSSMYSTPFSDVIHAIHSKPSFTMDGGSCQSCHEADLKTGEHLLWDYVKYDKFRGLSSVDAAKGAFRFDQNVVTNPKDVFGFNSQN